jgi:hypothetical protein
MTLVPAPRLLVVEAWLPTLVTAIVPAAFMITFSVKSFCPYSATVPKRVSFQYSKPVAPVSRALIVSVFPFATELSE